MFECELNIPNVRVTWKIDGVEVEQTPKHIVKADGAVHQLIITKCRPKDQGKVSCSYSKLETTATLTVEGMFDFDQFKPFTPKYTIELILVIDLQKSPLFSGVVELTVLM